MISSDRFLTFEKRYQRYAWLTLALNLAVILWGAYVRATGSGAGCGGHWPLCNGDVVPMSRTAETIIEYTHRVSSGIALLMTLGLFYFSRRYISGHRVRRAAIAASCFILIEALLGAILVLFDLVGGNTSVARAVVSALHLSNTYLLLGSITLTAVWARNVRGMYRPLRRVEWVLLALAFLGLMLVGASGAITALGDTLFPPGSLAVGISDEFSGTSHFLVQLRVLHPLIAIGVGMFITIGLRLQWFGEKSAHSDAFVRALVGLIVIQWVAGAVNVVLLAPIWLQLLHLLIADTIWIAFVVYTESLLFISNSTKINP
jgi:heme A synthase